MQACQGRDEEGIRTNVIKFFASLPTLVQASLLVLNGLPMGQIASATGATWLFRPFINLPPKYRLLPGKYLPWSFSEYCIFNHWLRRCFGITECESFFSRATGTVISLKKCLSIVGAVDRFLSFLNWYTSYLHQFVNSDVLCSPALSCRIRAPLSAVYWIFA